MIRLAGHREQEVQLVEAAAAGGNLMEQAPTVQHAQGARRQPIAASFVAGEIGFVNQHHVPAGARQEVGQRGTSRAGSDHEDCRLGLRAAS